MALLNFNRQTAHKQQTRTAPTKYIKGKLRYNFEQSEGQRIAEVFYPSRYLPVQFKDVETTDSIVIQKGKVVSVLGYGEYLMSADASGTIGNPNASGEIPVFVDRDGAVHKTPIDEHFWGYNETVCGLLVPANGGTDRVTADTYEYSAADVEAGTFKSDGTFAADGDDISGILASGNIPVGVAMYDVWQDIRGKYLNYNHWDKWGILQDWYVTVPYVREGDGGATYDTALSAEATADDSTILNSMRDQTFMTLASGVIPRAGSLVKADVRGNYIIESSSLSANPSVQTVARLAVIDNRFPKDMLEYVDTYQDSQMAGTDTGGIPYWLFIFAYKYLLGTTGSAPAIKDIVNAIRDGRFGMARFNLHVS